MRRKNNPQSITAKPDINVSQKIILSKSINEEVAALCTAEYDKIFVLTDETTRRLCRNLLSDCEPLKTATDITIGATDTCKTIDTLADVWRALGNGGASRHSLLVCLGGGMVTDLGGFAASTFKRGIKFINIPTTLLAMVDAAVGGKTGINFNGLKNEIGVFNESMAVVIDTDFLRTLDDANLRSGYAEMLKHSFLQDEAMWAEHLAFDLDNPDYAHLQTMVAESIGVKSRIVTEDPHEKGLRKSLNLGHTVGHAFESLALEENRPVLHGYAVAWGLACELYLSVVLRNFPQEKMRQTVDFIRQTYGQFNFTCDHYDRLYNFMCHDKKNVGGVINFTLLSDVGQISLDNHATKAQLFEMFDFLREG